MHNVTTAASNTAPRLPPATTMMYMYSGPPSGVGGGDGEGVPGGGLSGSGLGGGGSLGGGGGKLGGGGGMKGGGIGGT